MAWRYLKEHSNSYQSTFVNEDGETFTAETLSGKRRRYCNELHTGQGYTLGPDGKRKKVKLNQRQKAWRAGYMKAAKDSSSWFKRKNPGYIRKTTK